MDVKLVFNEVYRLYGYVRSRVQAEDVTVTNWSVQSIGNRVSSFEVSCQWESADGKKVAVKLSNWQPARVGAGYNGEKTSAVKRNSGLLWDKIGSVNFKNPESELTSLTGYLFDQILTGSALSGESGFKIGLLNAILKTGKPKTLVISIRRSALQEKPYTFDLTHVKAIVSGLMPRWSMIEQLPAQERSRGAAEPEKVDF